PPRLSARARVNPDLEALIHKMIAKRPDERPQTMEVVRNELTRLRSQADESGQPLFVRPKAGGTLAGGVRPGETERGEPRPPPPKVAPRGLPAYLVAVAALGGLVVAIGMLATWGRGAITRVTKGAGSPAVPAATGTAATGTAATGTAATGGPPPTAQIGLPA